MASLPGIAADWIPLAASQFLDVAVSTALTIPNPATQTPPISSKTYMYVALLMAQGAQQWIRTDGSAVTAAMTGGVLLNPGDTRTIYGYLTLSRVRVIRGAAGGALVVEYYLSRQQT